MADNSFDLFEGLASLSSRNLNWYNDLSDDGKKAASPFVIARWMSGTSDQAQIIRLNEVVNPYVFGGFDKGVLFKLMAIAATGSTKRYSWIKGPGSKSKKLSIEVVKQYYDCSTREAVTYKVTNDDLVEMAESCGWTPEELKKLTKEFDDDGTGTTKKSSVKSTKSIRGK